MRATVHLRARRAVAENDRDADPAVLHRVQRYRDVRHALVPFHRVVHRIVQRRRLRRQRDVVAPVQRDRLLGGQVADVEQK